MSRLSAISLLSAGVVVSALPLGLPSDATFVPPMLMAALIYLFSVLRPALPAWIAFLVGLASDVLSAGPLGYWAFIFLLVHTLAVQWQPPPGLGFAGLWSMFVITTAVVSLAGWLVACAYFFGAVDWQPMVLGGFSASALFPLLAWPLRRRLGLARAIPVAG
ncbi:MAG: hypothetical protein AB7U38_05060 [Hyphomicrobiales bacterium]